MSNVRMQWFWTFLAFYVLEAIYALSEGPLCAFCQMVDSVYGGLGILAFSNWIVAWGSYHMVYEKMSRKGLLFVLAYLPLRMGWVLFFSPASVGYAFAILGALYWLLSLQLFLEAKAPRQVSMFPSVSYTDAWTGNDFFCFSDDPAIFDPDGRPI